MEPAESNSNHRMIQLDGEKSAIAQRKSTHRSSHTGAWKHTLYKHIHPFSIISIFPVFFWMNNQFATLLQSLNVQGKNNDAKVFIVQFCNRVKNEISRGFHHFWKPLIMRFHRYQRWKAAELRDEKLGGVSPLLQYDKDASQQQKEARWWLVACDDWINEDCLSDNRAYREMACRQVSEGDEKNCDR